MLINVRIILGGIHKKRRRATICTADGLCDGGSPFRNGGAESPF
jgi:hypothetical protein